MPQITDTAKQTDIRPLLEAIVSLIDLPAAIIHDAQDVIVANEPWGRITICANGSDERLPLNHSLQGFSNVDELVAKLRDRTHDTGTAITSREAKGSSKGAPQNEYEVRWRLIQIPLHYDSLAIVTLRDMAHGNSPASVMDLQQARIDRLLVRQTLIEEAERRRLGQALHDVVVQDLAQVRSAVRSAGITADDSAKIIASVDRIIEEVRTLTFDLGPPILKDLGLRPALQWLAEHLSERYSADITTADDECNPRLTEPALTIIFRAVRELAINAAKHAPDAEIVISCVTNDRSLRITVRDTGPGFDTSCIHDPDDDIRHYGLLSVEQQIRGIGGSFEIFSEIGDGTRATITAPMEPQ